MDHQQGPPVVQRLQSRSQRIGVNVCVFCSHIKFLTRKTAVSDFPLYCANLCLAPSVRCSPGAVIPSVGPAVSHLCPSSLRPLVPPRLCPQSLPHALLHGFTFSVCDQSVGEPFISLQQATLW